MHNILGGLRPKDLSLLIGSIKSNLGHCEAASGLAGIIKVAMAFEKGCIPPNYDFRNPNPNIPFQEYNTKASYFHTIYRNVIITLTIFRLQQS